MAKVADDFSESFNIPGDETSVYHSALDCPSEHTDDVTDTSCSKNNFQSFGETYAEPTTTESIDGNISSVSKEDEDINSHAIVPQEFIEQVGNTDRTEDSATQNFTSTAQVTLITNNSSAHTRDNTANTTSEILKIDTNVNNNNTEVLEPETENNTEPKAAVESKECGPLTNSSVIRIRDKVKRLSVAEDEAGLSVAGDEANLDVAGHEVGLDAQSSNEALKSKSSVLSPSITIIQYQVSL